MYCLIATGYLTDSKAKLYINIPVGKRLDNISGATTQTATCILRQNGSYILGSNESPHGLNKNQGKFIINKDLGILRLEYTFSSALSAATNNDLVSVQFTGGSVVLS